VTLHVRIAHRNDILAWLNLGAEVEPLFGPLRYNPGFLHAIEKHIDDSTAFCVRVDNGPSGAPLMGGLLFSCDPPLYEISWLAVSAAYRRMGVAEALLNHAISLIQPPAELTLITFAEGVPGGEPARRLYAKFGFRPGEPGPDNPGGIPTQVFRRTFGDPPAVYAVIRHSFRCLMVQHFDGSGDETTEGQPPWTLPNGVVDPLTHDRGDALRRALADGFGLTIAAKRFVRRYLHGTRLHYVYCVRPESDAIRLNPDLFAGAAWLTQAEIRRQWLEGRLAARFIMDAIQDSATIYP